MKRTTNRFKEGNSIPAKAGVHRILKKEMGLVTIVTNMFRSVVIRNSREDGSGGIDGYSKCSWEF